MLLQTPNPQSLQISVDVGKFLRHVSPIFSWDNLLRIDKMREYLKKCSEAGVRADGLVTKCDRLITALTYYQMERVDPRDASTWSEVQHTIHRVDGWRKTYRKQKQELRTLSTARTLEAESEDEGRTEEEVKMVLTNDDIWSDFDSLVQTAQEGESIETSDLTLMTAAIGAILLLESCQRSGAISGATLHEYRSAKKQGEVWVMTVYSHKTQRHGPARVAVGDKFKPRIDNYVRYIRPLCDPFERTETLLSLPGGKPVSKLNSILHRLGDHYGIYIPTGTQLRKHTARACALKGTERERVLLSNTMSHTVDVHKRYYETVGTMSDVSEAYQVAKRVRQREASSNPKQSRREYTFSEVEAIKKFFQRELQQPKSPKLKLCRLFLQRHPNIKNRTPKHIQDKVRALQVNN